MQVIFFVFVFTFFGGAFAAPAEEWYDSSSSSSSHSQFYDGYPFGYTGTFAGAGAAAGAWPYPYGFINPFMPWPFFRPTVFKPWYKGDNVCQTKRTVDVPEEVQSWMNDGSSGSSQSENCRGNGESVICSKRVTNGEGYKIEYIKYFCCFSYIRDPRGTGCIKDPSKDAATATDAPTSPVKSEYHSTGDRFSYEFSSSGRDTTRGSDVEKVPPQ